MIKQLLLTACILICVSRLAHATPIAVIQNLVNALPPAGGEIKIACDTFTGGRLYLRSNVALVGSGPCTVLPPIVVEQPTQRHYNIRIENLVVDGLNDNEGYI